MKNNDCEIILFYPILIYALNRATQNAPRASNKLLMVLVDVSEYLGRLPLLLFEYSVEV